MVTLKKAAEKDIPFLVSLRNRTMKPHMENEGLEYLPEDQHARVMFSFENSRIIVHDDKNIGLLKVDKSTTPWKIIQFQLLPEFQNRGIGTRLLREIIEESDAAGCPVELNVLKGNKAQGLYKRLGFKMFEEKEHVYIMLRRPGGDCRLKRTTRKKMEIDLRKEIPEAEKYIEIRLKAGLSRKSAEAAETGLKNSIYCLVAYHDDEPVGIGRIIGDGGCFFEIVDIAVLPEYQKKGIGRRIMEGLMEYIHANALPTAYVSLMADHGTPEFYKKYGFECAELPKSSGMFLRI